MALIWGSANIKKTKRTCRRKRGQFLLARLWVALFRRSLRSRAIAFLVNMDSHTTE